VNLTVGHFEHAEGNPLDHVLHARTLLLLICREIISGIDNEWANFVNMAGFQGLHFHTVQPSSMEAELSCEHFFKTFLSPTTNVKTMLHTY
jgi:hypothetical protein